MEPEYWWAQRRHIQHADRNFEIIKEGFHLDAEEGGWVFHKLGYLYANQGRLSEAEDMYQRALRGREKKWGPRTHVDAQHSQQLWPSSTLTKAA